MGEDGWLFLANDPNEFLRVQFGELGWTAAERERAAGVLRNRRRMLGQYGIGYHKYIVPAKSVVYADKLPGVLAGLAQPEPRPAQMLAADAPEIVAYLAEDMMEARADGSVYFRAGAQANWAGAWVVYAGILGRLAAAGTELEDELIGNDDLLSNEILYEGGLVPMLSAEQRASYEAEYSAEPTVVLRLSPGRRRAARVELPADYAAWFPEHEQLAYERADGRGKRAVIFRDSTVEMCHDLIAQHFSRAVFIWHRGQMVEEVIARERADVVVHVMEERMVTRYRVFPVMSRAVAGSRTG
jgi:hypothetical protein